MTNDLSVAGAGDEPSPPQRNENPQQVLRVITTVLGAIGGLYLATGSVAVTVIGAVVAVVAAALYLLSTRG